jgi:hypothetical protein
MQQHGEKYEGLDWVKGMVHMVEGTIRFSSTVPYDNLLTTVVNTDDLIDALRKNPDVTTLIIARHTSLQEIGIAAILSTVLSRIHTISMSGCSMSIDGFNALGTYQTLTNLDLSHNYLIGSGTTAMVGMLERLPKLTTLDLSGCFDDEYESAVVLDHISDNTSLTSLCLRRCRVDAVDVAGLLDTNTILLDLTIGNHWEDFTDEGGEVSFCQVPIFPISSMFICVDNGFLFGAGRDGGVDGCSAQDVDAGEIGFWWQPYLHRCWACACGGTEDQCVDPFHFSLRVQHHGSCSICDRRGDTRQEQSTAPCHDTQPRPRNRMAIANHWTPPRVSASMRRLEAR